MKINKTLSCILLFLLIFSIVNLVQAARVWSIQTVDQNGYFLQGGIIRLDSNNNPRIVYSNYVSLDPRESGVVYAIYSGSSWSMQTIVKDGFAIDFSLDSHDNPHILYHDTQYNHDVLKYATLNGTDWSIQTIGKGFDASLAIDSADNPHIAYTWGNLIYASLNGSSWNTQTLTTTGNNVHPLLALDKHDNPHILYVEGAYINEEKSVKYLVWDSGSGWNMPSYQTVMTNFKADLGEGIICHFALDSDDYPHFTYEESYNLSYVSWDGTIWKNQSVAEDFDEGGYFTLDRYNQPHIVYFKGTSFGGNLIYAIWAGDKWDIQTVVENTATHPGTIAIDNNGTIHISYAGPSLYGNQSPTDVMYATATEPLLTPAPTATTTPVTSPAQIIEATIVISIIVVVVAVAGLLILLRKRKQ
jgi:hypothetical protein